MSDLPKNWVDKIFDLMTQFYREKWSKKFNSEFEIDLHKTAWFNALNGLSYEEIRHGLAVSKKNSISTYSKPPDPILFFHYCIDIPINRKKFYVEHVLRGTMQTKNNPK